VSAGRLRSEFTVWRGVWQQLTTFLDRIDGAAEMDEPQVKILSALLPVMGVIERARTRAAGMGLGPALSCAPRGRGMPGRALGDLVGLVNRRPGVEDQEFAVAMLKTNDDGELEDDPTARLWGTKGLFSFRDGKHGEISVAVPSYDFGALSGVLVDIPAATEAGHFPIDARKKAMETGEDEQRTWTQLRDFRIEKLEEAPGDKPKSLSATLAPLHLSDGYDALIAVGNGARAARDACNADKQILTSAGPVITEAGVDGEVVNALGAAADALASQAADYQFVIDKLTTPAVYQLTEGVLAQVKTRLERADRPGGIGIAPTLIALESTAAPALDDAVATRLAYPDGTLRTLRLMEWALRWQWTFRERWFERRRRLVLRPLFTRVMAVFCDSLQALRAGSDTGAPLAGTRLGRDVTAQATVLPIEPMRDLSKLLLGQIAIVRGERPTIALLLASEIKLGAPGQPNEQRLHVPPLNVSIETERGLPGIPGLVKKGTPIDGGRITITDEELRAGASAAGKQADALPQTAVALGSRLALILGRTGGPGRPAPPQLPAPFPSIEHFPIEEPVAVGATRLFLKSVPPPAQSGSARPIMMARPGEILLIRGADTDGNWWQSAIEVARVEALTGAAAREQDDATGTPTPTCCENEAPVIVVTLREMLIPHDLVRNVTISRSFQGFGPSSLAAREMLPETLDPDTATLRVTDGGEQKVVLRDPELQAAIRVLDGWLGSEHAVTA
jgi:hypothetical protein